MADRNPNPSHVHNHRSLRLKVPQRTAAVPSTFVGTPVTSRPYPQSYSTPTASATPSKHRLSGSSSSISKSKTSLSFLFLLLFSLRSLYSILPFLRSSPSFSLFPFSFLVSLLSFLLTYGFSLCTSLSSSSSSLVMSSSRDPFHQRQNRRIFSLTSITQSEHRILIARSILLAAVFLLRFQALRYCGAAAMILAELSGNVAARFMADGAKSQSFGGDRYGFLNSKARGFVAMVLGLLLLSVSWDRIECFPFSAKLIGELSFSVIPKGTCLRIWPMLLPFLSGFLGCYERVSMNRGTTKLLGMKQVRLISLFYTTLVLFIPATISIIISSDSIAGSFSFGSLIWPLMNTVIFGVLLAENSAEEKLTSSKDFRREFLVTFACTLVLELFYFPELSLSGLFICGAFLYISVHELDPSKDADLGSDSFRASSIMNPIKHILSERKSRKIALFLMINAGYMVVEFAVGFMSNSLGLISDACHMLFDCAALAIGLYASYISRLPASGRFNYGRGRFEVLSGYVNAVFLVLVGSLIVLESLERILDPQEISTGSLLSVSIGGLVVNVIGLIFFHEEHHHAHGGSCSHSHSHDHGSPIRGNSGTSSSLHHGELDHVQSGGSCSHTHDHDHVHSSVSHGNSGKSSSHHHEPHGHLGHHQSRGSCSHNTHDHDHSKGSCSHTHDHNHDHTSVSHGNSGNSSSHHHEPHSHLDHDQSNGACSHNTHGHDHKESSGKSSSHNHGQDHKLDHGHTHRHVDHNMEGIFLHVLADTLGSVGVVISTLVIRYKGWLAADPICSIFISVLIVSSVIPLLRNSAEVLLQRVPRAHRLGLRKAAAEIRRINGVRGVRGLRVWSFTATELVGTVNLCLAGDADRSAVKSKASELLREAGVNDLTLQIECVR